LDLYFLNNSHLGVYRRQNPDELHNSVAVFLALGPVTATAQGAAVPGEPVTPLSLSGLAAVIAGL